MRCISKAKNGKVEEDVARLFRCGKKCDGDRSLPILSPLVFQTVTQQFVH